MRIALTLLFTVAAIFFASMYLSYEQPIDMYLSITMGLLSIYIGRSSKTGV